MGEAKNRADAIEQAKAQAAAQQQAQAYHEHMMQHPATFASAFYLADASGSLRIVLHEQSVPARMPVVRGAFVVPDELLVHLLKIGPSFLEQKNQARAQMMADLAKQGGQPLPEVKIVEGGEVRAEGASLADLGLQEAAPEQAAAEDKHTEGADEHNRPIAESADAIF